MTRCELDAKSEMEEEGWTVLRPGWPDFLIVRRAQDGGLDVAGVEVKSAFDPLKPIQALTLKIMDSMGFPGNIHRELTPRSVLQGDFVRRRDQDLGKIEFMALLDRLGIDLQIPLVRDNSRAWSGSETDRSPELPVADKPLLTKP